MVGGGGGNIIVPMLSYSGMEQKKSHAMSVAIIMPICIVSSVFYYFKGYVTFLEVKPFLIPVLSGALLGAFILPKCNSRFLKGAFSAVMIYSGIRLLLN